MTSISERIRIPAILLAAIIWLKIVRSPSLPFVNSHRTEFGGKARALGECLLGVPVGRALGRARAWAVARALWPARVSSSSSSSYE